MSIIFRTKYKPEILGDVMNFKGFVRNQLQREELDPFDIPDDELYDGKKKEDYIREYKKLSKRLDKEQRKLIDKFIEKARNEYFIRINERTLGFYSELDFLNDQEVAEDEDGDITFDDYDSGPIMRKKNTNIAKMLSILKNRFITFGQFQSDDKADRKSKTKFILSKELSEYSDDLKNFLDDETYVDLFRHLYYMDKNIGNLPYGFNKNGNFDHDLMIDQINSTNHARILLTTEYSS